MSYEEKWRELLAASIVYRVNFKMLHWAAAGRQFQKIHDLAEDYANLMVTIEDEVAERLGRIPGSHFVSYNDASNVLQSSQIDHMCIGSETTEVNLQDFFQATQSMLTNLMICITAILEDEESKKVSNVGMKAYLEGLYDSLDKEARYLNPRRMDFAASSQNE